MASTENISDENQENQHLGESDTSLESAITPENTLHELETQIKRAQLKKIEEETLKIEEEKKGVQKENKGISRKVKIAYLGTIGVLIAFIEVFYIPLRNESVQVAAREAELNLLKRSREFLQNRIEFENEKKLLQKQNEDQMDSIALIADSLLVIVKSIDNTNDLTNKLATENLASLEESTEKLKASIDRRKSNKLEYLNTGNDLSIEGKSILLFTASWSRRSKDLEQTFNNIAGEYPNVRFLLIREEDNIEVFNKYEVNSVPQILLISEDNSLKKRYFSKVTEKDIRDALQLLN